MTNAANLPIASIVALPGLDGIYLKERESEHYLASPWIRTASNGARSADDAEVDEALADGATVLRAGA